MSNTTAPRRRGRKPPMAQVSLNLPDDVLLAVERQANLGRLERSQVLRDPVIQALEARGKLKPVELI